MGIVLKVTPDVLKRMAEDIRQQVRDIQIQFEDIDGDINRTRSYWEGEASDTHKSWYDDMKDELTEAVKRLENHPQNLLQMAGLYSETESKLEAVAQTLQADVII